MSANASIDPDREDFARSLSRFARALAAGGTQRGDDPAFSVTEALNGALAAARWDARAAGARSIAYRNLVRRFLHESAAHRTRPAKVAPAGARPALAATALRARPASDDALAVETLRGLAPIERAALLLVAVERFSYLEAADLMELAPEEFVAALARAREAFAARLATSAARGKPHLRLVE